MRSTFLYIIFLRAALVDKSKGMDIHQRRVGFRFDGVRTILGLSLFEFSRLLNRSHYTLAAIERSIRYPTDDLIEATIALAAKHDMILSCAWLRGEAQAVAPTSVRFIYRKRLRVKGTSNLALSLLTIESIEKNLGIVWPFCLKTWR